MKRVSTRSRIVAIVIEDWRRPYMPLSEYRNCFNGKGVNVMGAKYVTFERAKEIVPKKSKGRK